MIYSHQWQLWNYPYFREGEGFLEQASKKRAAGQRRKYNMLPALVKTLKGNEQDSHVFILTTEQEEGFEKFIKDYELESHIAYRMPYKVTNPNHQTAGRRLRLYLFQSPNHPQRSN